MMAFMYKINFGKLAQKNKGQNKSLLEKKIKSKEEFHPLKFLNNAALFKEGR